MFSFVEATAAIFFSGIVAIYVPCFVPVLLGSLGTKYFTQGF